MLQSLKPSPRKLIKSLRRSLLPSNLLSTTTAAAAATATTNLSFIPLLDHSSQELNLRSSDIAASFADWFRRGAAPVSPLDQIYAVLSSTPDDAALDSALSALGLRLSEDLVLRALRHRPRVASADDDLLVLRIRFFDWSGRQRGYRHTRAAYHAIFRALSRARLAYVVLDWLHIFSSARDEPPSSRHHHPFLRSPSANLPRFHDTLVLGYSLAARPELALQLFARMRYQGLDLDPFTYHALLNSLVEADLFDFADTVLAQIKSRGLADNATACIEMKSLCLQGKIAQAEDYLRELVSDDGPKASQRAVGTLVTALCRKGKFTQAGQVVEEFGTSVAYGIWLSNLLRARQIKTAMDFLQSKKATEGYVAEDFHYNRIIGVLLVKNQLQEVYDMLVEMMDEGIPPDMHTMNASLCFFCKAGMVDVAVQLYNSRKELGYSPKYWVYDHLIKALCRGGSVEEAYRVLEESLEQGCFPGQQTFNVLTNLLCQEGRLDKMRQLVDLAHESKIKPTTAVFAKWLSALCKAGMYQEALLVPGMVPRGDVHLAKFRYIYTSLIHAVIVMKKADVLPLLLIRMQKQGHSPNRHLFREVVCCLCEMGMFDVVLDLLDKQLELKCLDQRTCYNYFIYGAAHSKKVEMARELYNRMVIAGIEPNMDTDILLLQGFLNSRRIGDALSFFYSLQEKREPSSKLYNAFISGLCQAGEPRQAGVLWREARYKGIIPSLQCYEDLVLMFCTSGDYDNAVKVLEDFKKTGRPVSSFLYNVLLLHSLKGQQLLRAWVQLGDGTESSEPEPASRGTLEPGRMNLSQLIYTFSGGIRMKENIDNLDEVIEKFFPVDIFTYNMLLRGLCMAGRMDSACNLFHRMCRKGYEPNRFSFDIIVHGFCKHGRRNDAERWMEDMYRSGFTPTRYTMRIYNNTP